MHNIFEGIDNLERNNYDAYPKIIYLYSLAKPPQISEQEIKPNELEFHALLISLQQGSRMTEEFLNPIKWVKLG